MLTRLTETLRRRGPLGTLRMVAARVSPWSRWEAEFVWYALDLRAADRPRRFLADEFELRHGTIDDLGLLGQLPPDPEVITMTRSVVQERLDDGAQLWLVTEGDRTAFRCWIFREAVPLQGVPGRKLPVPPDMVVLEDSIASPDFRGRGVAPGAWSMIADALSDEPALSLMWTKVSVGNAPTRHGLEKVGFRALATMRMSGPAWRTRIVATPENGAGDVGWLEAAER